jgi:hypothetical protein
MSFFTRLSIQLSILGKFWQEKINGQLFRWNLILIFGQIIYLFLRFNDLPPQIPVFFSLSWGESQLGSTSILFILPTLSIIICLANNFIAAFLHHRSFLFSRLLVIFSLIFSILSAISLVNIINLAS